MATKGSTPTPRHTDQCKINIMQCSVGKNRVRSRFYGMEPHMLTRVKRHVIHIIIQYKGPLKGKGKDHFIEVFVFFLLLTFFFYSFLAWFWLVAYLFYNRIF